MKQEEALEILKTGANVFLTGQAGSGKTFVLNKYIDYLKQRNVGVGVTASTGIAATHLGGMTIHSWSGLGIRERLAGEELKKLLKRFYLRKRFLLTEVLIIDEISMLHGYQLDLVNYLCQAFRQSLLPFGGLQVVMAGDFFQLPPVARGQNSAEFVNKAKVWQAMDIKTCYLSEQFRQGDSDYLKILNEIRANNVSEKSRACLVKRIDGNFKDDNEATKLYTHNFDVDEINLRELDKINGPAKSYTMRSDGRLALAQALRAGCLAPEKLILKKGAKVMFVKNNFELGVVNGTVGLVVGFDEDGYPRVKIKTGEEIVARPASWTIDEDGRVLAEIRQIPLRLAWAITVHKSQGLSLDRAEIDLSKAFAAGMGYVALSRVRNLAGLILRGFNELALRVDEEVLKFDQELQEMSFELAQAWRVMPTEQKIEKYKFERSKKKKSLSSKKSNNKEKTKELVDQKIVLGEIAAKLGFKESTIVGHLEKLANNGEKLNIEYLLPKAEARAEIMTAFDKLGEERLSPVNEFLGEKYDYEVLKLCRVYRRMGANQVNQANQVN